MRPRIGGKLHVQLTVPILDRLRERAETQGLSVSEIIRGALADFLDWTDAAQIAPQPALHTAPQPALHTAPQTKEKTQ